MLLSMRVCSHMYLLRSAQLLIFMTRSGNGPETQDLSVASRLSAYGSPPRSGICVSLSRSRRGEHTTSVSYTPAQPPGTHALRCRSSPQRWATDTEDLARAVKGLRHGAFRFQGCLALGGWIPVRVAADRLRVTIAQIRDAIAWTAATLSQGCNTML